MGKAKKITGPHRRKRTNLAQLRKARQKKDVACNPQSNSDEVLIDNTTQTSPAKSTAPCSSAATAPTASFIYFSELQKQQTSNLAREEDDVFKGRRLISCTSLDDCMDKISAHCHPGMQLKRSKELAFGGLHRDICYKCKCGFEVLVSSNHSTENYSVNNALAEGCLIAPIGYEAAATLLTTLDLPVPSPKFFSKCQNDARKRIDSYVDKMLLEAGREEKRLAEEAGDFITIDNKQLVWITVILDGGWAKRSYSHTYDSPCGVAVIIGARTGKVLFFGTRTKTCLVCSKATNKGESPKEHLCYKNWEKASTAMEQDIVLEGFKKSINVHGLVYKRFVGDGDSSVHAAVINVYPGLSVEKIECYNHVTKNLNKKLHNIANDAIKGKNAPTIPKAERKLPNMEEFFRRVGAGVHGSIVHHSQHIRETGRFNLLREDIKNVPHHVFGDHSKCQPYFCDPEGDRRTEPNLVPKMSTLALWKPLITAVDHVADLAPGLIYKMNTNWAEAFMSVANKYVEGKRKHLGGSFLYGLRMSCAVLTFNMSRYWLPDMYSDFYGIQPSPSWLRWKERGIRVRQQSFRKRIKKRNRKFGFLKSRKGDEFYGSEPNTPELNEEQLEFAIEELYRKLQLNESQRSAVEESTRDQSESDTWFEERRPRITASVAGKLFKLQPTTDNTATLNALLKENGQRGIVAIEYGKESEGTAIAAYEKLMGYSPGFVKRVGLTVSEEDGIFGASSDGLVGDRGSLEVKCPYSIREKSPADWPSQSRDSPLACINGVLSLKQNHNYYYQIVMQMYVCNRDWVDFVVWTLNGIHVERITKNSYTLDLWGKMKGKLTEFWRRDLAPELVDSCKKRGKPYRCSEQRLVGRNRITARKQRKADKENEGNGEWEDV